MNSDIGEVQALWVEAVFNRRESLSNGVSGGIKDDNVLAKPNIIHLLNKHILGRLRALVFYTKLAKFHPNCGAFLTSFS